MNSNNIFQVLWATLAAKVTPILTKIKLWTSWNFIRTRVIAGIRGFFAGIFNVRPKNKKDYYEVFGWLVSKRLAFAVVVVVTTVCALYLVNLGMARGTAANGAQIKRYSYRSVFLKLADGQVQILGDGGYLAYEGQVAKGYVAGNGRLYNREGGLVYQGEFDKNCFEGTGTQYYGDGTIHYQGQFSGNLYEGTGKLYRSNGSLWYNGSFVQGMMEGEGVLYDAGNNAVYRGNFTRNRIVYTDFIGKSTTEASKLYTGKRVLYEDEDNFAVWMKDIGALYVSMENADSLDGSMVVESVYVLENSFPAGAEQLTTIEELRSYFGSQDYDGQSRVTMPEAVCFGLLSRAALDCGVETEKLYDDYYQVTGYARDTEVYLYSFEKDDLVYTFVCESQDGGFAYYNIAALDGGEG